MELYSGFLYSMLNPLSTISDYMLHPRIGEFLTYTQTYREALQSAQAETIFKEKF